jgi:EAL domain-containing protein (putative c-di-GMP-specific phosphodiesterase class I)
MPGIAAAHADDVARLTSRGRTPHAVLGRWLHAASHVDRLPTSAAVGLLTLLTAGAAATVWLSGGSGHGLTLLLCLPVLVAALRFGTSGAVVVAAAAALVAGPLMPLSTATGEPQPTAVWVSRTGALLLVAVLAGAVVESRDRSAERRLAVDLRAIERPTPSRTTVDRDLLPLLPRVLAERRFRPVFQPIYDLADGRLLAVEAVTRFDGVPDRSPDRWFAAAHAAGLGVELELAAIEAALHGAQGLPTGVRLSCNASPATVADQRLVELVRAHPGRPLTMEITEHAVIEDYPLLREALAALVCLGVELAVDDAGAGFASLQHIVQLEPDVIKLDMSLTQDVASSPLRRALAASIVDFTERSGARLVVEGVETVEDLTAWAALGAQAVQGFAVGRPGLLPAAPRSALLDTLVGTLEPARV